MRGLPQGRGCPRNCERRASPPLRHWSFSSGKAGDEASIRKPGDLPSRVNREAGRGAPGEGWLVSERVPHLHICVTCRAGRELEEGEVPPGQRLHDAVIALLGQGAPVRVQAVQCLASCERGCAAAISAPGKWGYLLGFLSDALAPDLLTYGGAYAASRTGTVMPSKRPASLARSVLGRFPALETL